MGQTWADDSTRVMHVVVMTVFCFIAVVAVLFRLWARKIQRFRLELNDYLCIAGLVCVLPGFGVNCAEYDAPGIFIGTFFIYNAL